MKIKTTKSLNMTGGYQPLMVYMLIGILIEWCLVYMLKENGRRMVGR